MHDCTNAIIKCGQIIWFGFFFFFSLSAVKILPGKKDLCTKYKALWIGDTIHLKTVFWKIF